MGIGGRRGSGPPWGIHFVYDQEYNFGPCRVAVVDHADSLVSFASSPITESRPHDSSPSVFDMVSIGRVNNTTRPCTVISQCQAATEAAALESKVAVSGRVHASFTGGGGW